MISEGDETSEGREKGAYYIPLTGHTLLRKRRARVSAACRSGLVGEVVLES